MFSVHLWISTCCLTCTHLIDGYILTLVHHQTLLSWNTCIVHKFIGSQYHKVVNWQSVGSATNGTSWSWDHTLSWMWFFNSVWQNYLRFMFLSFFLLYKRRYRAMKIALHCYIGNLWTRSCKKPYYGFFYDLGAQKSFYIII